MLCDFRELLQLKARACSAERDPAFGAYGFLARRAAQSPEQKHGRLNGNCAFKQGGLYG